MKTLKIDRRGGARKNAGRHSIPIGEKKVQISFYVRQKNALKLREELKKLLKNLDK